MRLMFFSAAAVAAGAAIATVAAVARLLSALSASKVDDVVRERSAERVLRA